MITDKEIVDGKKLCMIATHTDGTYSRVGNAHEQSSTFHTHIEEDEEIVASFTGDNKENDCLFYALHNPSYVLELYREIERLKEWVNDLQHEVLNVQERSDS